MLFNKYWGASIIVAASLSGCGGSGETAITKQKIEQIASGNTDEDQRAKIKAALEKAGVKGDIALIEDTGKNWTVEITPAAGPDGKGRKTGGLQVRPAYLVDKSTMQVTSPSGKKGGGAVD